MIRHGAFRAYLENVVDSQITGKCLMSYEYPPKRHPRVIWDVLFVSKCKFYVVCAVWDKIKIFHRICWLFVNTLQNVLKLETSLAKGN